MHICFVCGEYPPGKHGGIGSFTQTLARELVRQGHSCSVVGFYKQSSDTQEVDEGVRVFRLSNSKIPNTGFIFNSIKLLGQLKKINEHHTIDIIDGPENSYAFVPKKFHLHKVIRMHGGHHYLSVMMGNKPSLWRGLIEKRSFERADHFCAVSNFVSESTRSIMKLGKTKITVLPNPVNTSFFSPLPEIAIKKYSIGFVGTVYELKGVRQLIQAMPGVLRTIPEAHLYIVGRDTINPRTKGSYIQELKKEISKDEHDHISFLGSIEHKRIPEFLAEMDICVFPSYIESNPLAVVEAMAIGKPIIITNRGPGPEIIKNKVSGLLCDPYSPDDIAQKIIFLMSDKKMKRSLGKAARIQALEKYSIDKLVSENIIFYEECLESTAS